MLKCQISFIKKKKSMNFKEDLLYSKFEYDLLIVYNWSTTGAIFKIRNRTTSLTMEKKSNGEKETDTGSVE